MFLISTLCLRRRPRVPYAVRDHDDDTHATPTAHAEAEQGEQTRAIWPRRNPWQEGGSLRVHEQQRSSVQFSKY